MTALAVDGIVIVTLMIFTVVVGIHKLKNVRLLRILVEVSHLTVCVQWAGLDDTGVDQSTLIVPTVCHCFEGDLRQQEAMRR